MPKAFFRVITPKKELFDMDVFVNESVKSLRKFRRNASKDFRKTVRTWSNKPNFQGTTPTRARLIAQVWANDNEWVWVNLGTRPHIIRPRRSPVLVFPMNFTSKTIPRRIGSRRGGSSGDLVFTRRPVRHPGSEGREIHVVVAENLEPEFIEDMQDAVKKAAK